MGYRERGSTTALKCFLKPLLSQCIFPKYLYMKHQGISYMYKAKADMYLAQLFLFSSLALALSHTHSLEV